MAFEREIQNEGWRKKIIAEILNDENKRRKETAKIRWDVFKDNQDQHLLKKLTKEFGQETVSEMRIITSINLTKRIINEQASIYKASPDRTYLEASTAEIELLKKLYLASRQNVKLKKSNKYFKLYDQCAIQVIPMNGMIKSRVLAPHHYDVVPDPDSVEDALIYILNISDQNEFLIGSDRIDQVIADKDDFERARMRMRFIWWSELFHFKTDGNGIVKSVGINADGVLAPMIMPNPIGVLPFIDVVGDKDFEFWIRQGKNTVGFNLDFSSMMSDTATINKIQGYAQAVVSGMNLPENMVFGPNRLLRLPQDGTEATPPTFEFANPNPDLASSLNLLDMMVNFFLSAEGLDPKIISGKTEGTQSFSSGAERLLAEISKFSASREDIDLFESVEQELFDLIRLWNNELQGTDFLDEELRGPQISEKVKLKVDFAEPELLMNETEREDSVIKRLSSKLISKVEAISELRGITKEEAQVVMDDMQEESKNNVQTFMQNLGGPNGQIGRNSEDQLQGEPNGSTGPGSEEPN